MWPPRQLQIEECAKRKKESVGLRGPSKKDINRRYHIKTDQGSSGTLPTHAQSEPPCAAAPLSVPSPHPTSSRPLNTRVLLDALEAHLQDIHHRNDNCLATNVTVLKIVGGTPDAAFGNLSQNFNIA